MKRQELQEWIKRVVACAASGRPVEDAYVELKEQITKDNEKTAGQLAAHANAAGGEHILWLIGMREDGTIHGAKRDELARWYPAVHKHFDGVYPRLIKVMNVPLGHKSLVALLFSSGEAPYLVNRADGTTYVPWREANRTRSIRRQELMALFSDLVQLPTLDLLEGKLEAHESKDLAHWFFHFTAGFYVKPKNSKPITIPFHECTGCFWVQGLVRKTPFEKLAISYSGESEASYHVIIRKPGVLRLDGTTLMRRSRIVVGGDARVEIVLRPVNAARSLELSCCVPFKSYKSQWREPY